MFKRMREMSQTDNITESEAVQSENYFLVTNDKHSTENPTETIAL